MKFTACGCEAVLDGKRLTLKNARLTHCIDGVDSITVRESDHLGCSAPMMEVRAVCGHREEVYTMWSDLPVVRMTPSRTAYLTRIFGEHWTVRSIKLRAFTDDSDLLAEEHFEPTFRSGLQRPLEGELFFLEDVESGNAIMILSETPDYVRGKLSITQGKPRFKPGEDRGGGYVSLDNRDNPVVLGFCRVGECEALCRAYYRHVNQRKELVTMSNTWGDAHGRDCVCHDFVMKEIDAAREIGVDIVQIDDGWQVNGTRTAAPRDAEGYRDFSGDSWEINEDRFPHGLKTITEYAARDGIRVGMWMAPYSWNEFSHLERDCAVLKRAYDEWGFRFFKLDMYQVTSERSKQRLLRMLESIYELGGDVSVQMDVTRHDRLNYLCGAEYGTIFAENRYTELANYFPHRILRHLWTIGRFLPTSRFQFEIVNPDRDTEHYNEGDPFVPSLYTMDYLFAATMLSNPLFWMEMQFLSDERRAQLAPLMTVWKAHRDALVKGDVSPIGEKPNGRSLTGFAVKNNEKTQYVLLFREVTDRTGARFAIPDVTESSRLTVLASNTSVTLAPENGSIYADFSSERGYVFAKID